MKYFSLFSGIGGFELGIQRSLYNKSIRFEVEGKIDLPQDMSNINESGIRRPKATCVGFSEIDKYATQIYKKHFPNHKEYGDVSKIKWNDVEDFDLLCGGFPCQSFSIAGKRGGFDDTRGTLFFEIARAAQHKQPRLLLLENVKGLLSHNQGETFHTILKTLDGIGYDLQWQVLNSKNFGVPQNRERVFIIGHLRGTSRPQVFPIGTYNSKNNSMANESNEIRNRTWSGSLRARGTTSYGSGDVFIKTKEVKIRRLTPTECERLQSFPDDWTEGISDTQRYKCLGNAVTVNVIQAIMEKLLNARGGKWTKFILVISVVVRNGLYTMNLLNALNVQKSIM